MCEGGGWYCRGKRQCEAGTVVSFSNVRSHTVPGDDTVIATHCLDLSPVACNVSVQLVVLFLRDESKFEKFGVCRRARMYLSVRVVCCGVGGAGRTKHFRRPDKKLCEALEFESCVADSRTDSAVYGIPDA